jgi:hypothetical protein
VVQFAFAATFRADAPGGAVYGWEVRNFLAILAGLRAAPLLMLTAVSMRFRSSVEFYPLFTFATLMGMKILCSRAPGISHLRRRNVWIFCAIGVLAAHE